MAVKNDVLGKTHWIGNEVAGAKITFFKTFLTQPAPTLWPKKAKYRIPYIEF